MRKSSSGRTLTSVTFRGEGIGGISSEADNSRSVETPFVRGKLVVRLGAGEIVSLLTWSLARRCSVGGREDSCDFLERDEGGS